MYMYSMRILISIIVLLFVFDLKIVHGDSFDPWSFKQSNSDAVPGSKSSRELSPAAWTLNKGIHFFREYVSSVDGDRCVMHPSCSSYSINAIEKHGFIIGYIMTVDRLIHENDEMDIAEVIKIGETTRYHDSVENNDFWWYIEKNGSRIRGVK
jgi:putative component of membrane protein insertase Oxa1/YidC/SpoIIIJ protein YidD